MENILIAVDNVLRLDRQCLLFYHREGFYAFKILDTGKCQMTNDEASSSSGWRPVYNGLLRDLGHWSDVSGKKDRANQKVEGTSDLRGPCAATGPFTGFSVLPMQDQ